MFRRLFPRPVTIAPAVPFRPLNAVALTADQIREGLRGQKEAIPVAAMVQLLEAQIGVAIHEMSTGVDGAAGTYRMLKEFYEGAVQMITAEK